MSEEKNVFVSGEETARQRGFLALIKVQNDRFYSLCGRRKTAFVHSYGCQQNAVDGEKLAGMLAEAGYLATDDPKAADVTVYNTCAVRENAEDRVYGNTGALLASKRANPDKIICLCGCMIQQESAAQHIKKHFPYVDMLVGTNALHRFPELLYRRLTEKGAVYETPGGDGVIAEGLPTLRADSVFAGVPVSYGCNNFCTYCVVPYVRGRERSRTPDAVLAEVGGLVRDGYRDITLLGQNVNSYGNDRADCPPFPQLLKAACAFDGDYRVRFMTSHPKDAGEALFESMAATPRAAKHLHLPVQSGSGAVLRRMNRRYTPEEYLAKLSAARRICPDLAVTSDIIVGFPGETEADFSATLELVREARFDTLFMFVYSRRNGTPAADFPEQVDEAAASERFGRLLKLQEGISAEINAAAVGRTVRVLAQRCTNGRYTHEGKTGGVMRVLFNAPDEIDGNFINVKITGAGPHWVSGEPEKSREE